MARTFHLGWVFALLLLVGGCEADCLFSVYCDGCNTNLVLKQPLADQTVAQGSRLSLPLEEEVWEVQTACPTSVSLTLTTHTSAPAVAQSEIVPGNRLQLTGLARGTTTVVVRAWIPDDHETPQIEATHFTLQVTE